MSLGELPKFDITCTCFLGGSAYQNRLHDFLCHSWVMIETKKR